MIIWTPAVLSVLYACVSYFCICACSAQLSMFHMERRSRNTLISISISIRIIKLKQRQTDGQADRLTGTDRQKQEYVNNLKAQTSTAAMPLTPDQ